MCFSRLLLLARGRAVYSGPVRDAVAHFEGLVGAPLPPLTNPADWLIDLVDSGAAVPAEAPALTLGLATPAVGLVEKSKGSIRRWQTCTCRATVARTARGAPLHA